MTLKLNGTTSGSVSLDAPATGSNISFTLPGSVGTSGQLLSTNGAGVLSFVNGGKILQIVRATDSTDRTTTSTTMVDASISVTITPQKSDSAILLLWNMTANHGGTNDSTRLSITDSSNNAISGAANAIVGSGSTSDFTAQTTVIAYATPATTSATTFKGRFRASNSGTAYLINAVNIGQMYAIEVAA